MEDVESLEKYKFMNNCQKLGRDVSISLYLATIQQVDKYSFWILFTRFPLNIFTDYEYCHAMTCSFKRVTQD